MEVKCTVNLNGIEEALQQLGPKLARKTLRRALTKVGDFWTAEMKSRVPVLKGDLRESIGAKVTTKRGRRGEVSIGTVSVGPSFNTRVERKDGDGSQQPAVYGLFVEMGTVKTKAEPFARPTFDATADKALGLFVDTLREDLDDILK